MILCAWSVSRHRGRPLTTRHAPRPAMVTTERHAARTRVKAAPQLMAAIVEHF